MRRRLYICTRDALMGITAFLAGWAAYDLYRRVVDIVPRRRPSSIARGLRGERNGLRPGERAGQLGEDRQIGMEPDARDPSHAEGQ